MIDRPAIVAAPVTIYGMKMLTVTEFAYLPPWFMITLGCMRLRDENDLIGSRRSCATGADE